MGRKRKDRRRHGARELMPSAGAGTDFAGRHADDEAVAVDWPRAAALPEFRRLLAAKRAFIVPATLFFILYYFSLPILVGYAPEVMKRRVLGPVNLAYLFALSQFVMAWGLAAWYLGAAARFDAMARAVIAAIRTRRTR